MERKLFALIFVSITILGISSMVNAQVTASANIPSPGVLPDNPFYGFKKFVESLQLFFTFDPVSKAQLHLQFADQRLSELNQSIAENKTQNIPRLEQDYQNELNATEDELNTSQALGRNVTDLAEHVAAETFKHQLILQNLLGQVPDQARIHIENAINQSQTGHEQAVESIFASRNITGTVTVTFTIGNQTFTQTFNITQEHGQTHVEQPENETETQTETSETETTTGTEFSGGNITCNNNFDCPENMECQNSTCVSVGCVSEGGQIPGAISPDYRKHMATECCPGLQTIPYSELFNISNNCQRTFLVGAPSGVCSKCGNGVCESWETNCTCPQDCRTIPTSNPVQILSVQTIPANPKVGDNIQFIATIQNTGNVPIYYGFECTSPLKVAFVTDSPLPPVLIACALCSLNRVTVLNPNAIANVSTPNGCQDGGPWNLVNSGAFIANLTFGWSYDQNNYGSIYPADHSSTLYTFTVSPTNITTTTTSISYCVNASTDCGPPFPCNSTCSAHWKCLYGGCVAECTIDCPSTNPIQPTSTPTTPSVTTRPNY